MSQYSAFENSYQEFYLREFDYLFSDLPVNDQYLAENTITIHTRIVHRDVNCFLKSMTRAIKIERFDINARLLAHYCLQGSAYMWFFEFSSSLQKYLTQDLDILCKKLVEIFESKEQKQRIQQQAEEVRIAKERAEVFACRRCSVKFSSNTKLHQHIQNHHQKKSAKSASEFAIISSNSESTAKAMLVKFTSSELAYHTSIAPPTSLRSECAKFNRNELANSTSSEFAKSSSPSTAETFGHSDVKPHKVMFFAERCASYINYPPTQYFSSGQLLSANFSCKQNPDMSGQVYCEICDLEFYEFRNDENPYKKHCDYSPTCPWVLAERTPKAVLTPPATPKKQISSAEITSRPTASPLRLRLPIATPRNVPKVTEIASMACPPTPPPSPPRNSAPKHPKPYLTIDDLFRMFAGKSKRTDLLRTNGRTKKSKSPPKLSNQTKITSYFKPAANRSPPISQDPKTPNPKSFHQRMPAETPRTILPPKPTKPEISTNSPYKMTLISRSTPLTESSKSSAKITHLQASSISASSQVSSHVCRTCSGTFRSSIGLQHAYDRSISTKGLATAQRTLESAVALLAPEILDRALEKWDLISLLLVCITIRLFS